MPPGHPPLGQRYVVAARAVGRYRCAAPRGAGAGGMAPEGPLAEEGTGGLHYAEVETLDDRDAAADLSEELAARVAAGRERAVAAAGRLPPAHRRQLLARFGDPAEARSPQKLSFWLASCLKMSESTRHRLFTSTDLRQRLIETLNLLDAGLARAGGTATNIFNLAGSGSSSFLSTFGSSVVLIVAILIGLYIMRFEAPEGWGTPLPEAIQKYATERSQRQGY
uniref:Uncharacterized protein n=1 Tax=Heterosigma akashiwo TaxID=2829 RepID=A0A7S3UXC0_HETAK